MKITLAQALKLKKRVVQTIGQKNKLITANNQMLKDSTIEVDVSEEVKLRAKLVNSLIDLKEALAEANKPIRKLIFKLSELKSEIALLESLPTKHGIGKEEYGTDKIEYVSTIRAFVVQKLVKQLQKEIDETQEKIDAFNYTTKIEVPEVEL